VNLERFFHRVKHDVIADLGTDFDRQIFEKLSLSFIHVKQSSTSSSDHYRSKTAKVPAYYNPNSHTVHLNIPILESAKDSLVENIFYHELIHAASHHDRLTIKKWKVLKSGLKMQIWNEKNRQTIINRNLNEGLTQYFANLNTEGGPAYKNEVEIVGRLIQKIGLTELKAAYFGPHIDKLERKTNAVLGTNVFEQISKLVDERKYEEARALL
jgi:hypothetical protein